MQHDVPVTFREISTSAPVSLVAQSVDFSIPPTNQPNQQWEAILRLRVEDRVKLDQAIGFVERKNVEVLIEDASLKGRGRGILKQVKPLESGHYQIVVQEGHSTTVQD